MVEMNSLCQDPPILLLLATATRPCWHLSLWFCHHCAWLRQHAQDHPAHWGGPPTPEPRASAWCLVQRTKWYHPSSSWVWLFSTLPFLAILGCIPSINSARSCPGETWGDPTAFSSFFLASVAWKDMLIWQENDWAWEPQGHWYHCQCKWLVWHLAPLPPLPQGGAAPRLGQHSLVEDSSTELSSHSRSSSPLLHFGGGHRECETATWWDNHWSVHAL